MRQLATGRRVFLDLVVAGGVVGTLSGAVSAASDHDKQTIVIEDDIRHLGDDSYDGSPNSEFRRPAEGRRIEVPFELSENQADANEAELRMLARGVEDYDNRVYINERWAQLNESPSDGTDEEQRFSVTPDILLAGTNTFAVESGENYWGDLDDFEISNVRLILSGVAAPPEPSIAISSTAPEIGEEVTLDASGSTAPGGQITEYRWDLDGDGNTDARGERISHAFDRAGPQEVELTVVDSNGLTATTTRQLSVAFVFTDASEKLSLADSLHGNSVLKVIEEEVGVDFQSDPEMASETLDALVRAVNDGRVPQAQAEAAYERHLLAERTTNEVLGHLGPGAADTNLARTVSEYAVQVAVDLGLMLATIKLGIAGASWAAAPKLEAARIAITDGLDYVIGEMTPAGSDVNLKTEMTEKCRQEAESVVASVQNGTLTSADAVADAVEDAVEGIVDTYADALRAWVELESMNAIVNSVSPKARLIGQTSLYGALRELDDAVSPDELATNGLRGNTGTASDIVDEMLPQLVDSIEGSVEEMNRWGDIGGAFNVYEAVFDFASSEEPSPRDLVELAISIAEVPVGVATKSGSAVGGLFAFIMTKRTHEQIIQSIIQGEYVEFTHV